MYKICDYLYMINPSCINLRDYIYLSRRLASVPVPFECEYACKVEDCEKVEKAPHIALRQTFVFG